MSVRAARILTAVYFTLFIVAVTWPGMLPFNRIRPLVLGLPFSLAWIVLWVVGGVFVLWTLHSVEGRGGGD